jgi:hypothetical protein
MLKAKHYITLRTIFAIASDQRNEHLASSNAPLSIRLSRLFTENVRVSPGLRKGNENVQKASTEAGMQRFLIIEQS